MYNYIEALDGVLMRINEKIHIDEHNPEWVRQYEYEKEQLCNALGDAVLGIEHIGSTSIPGIWAKPIVDIMTPGEISDL